MIRRPPRSTQSRSSAASDVYKRQLRHQLEVGERGDDGYCERHDEWEPGSAADLGRHFPGEGVDAGADDVPDDEEQEELASHDPLELGLLTGGCGLAHGASLRSSFSYWSGGLLTDSDFRLKGCLLY